VPRIGKESNRGIEESVAVGQTIAAGQVESQGKQWQDPSREAREHAHGKHGGQVKTGSHGSTRISNDTTGLRETVRKTESYALSAMETWKSSKGNEDSRAVSRGNTEAHVKGASGWNPVGHGNMARSRKAGTTGRQG